ncbi:diacylglycerol kinase [Parahaliea maris]|uniref:Diacylglycerol kinase n=1 Tax=Parahaliea maris TaxID=2716870 RepID=A0A5C9AA56_9GAMM|nr:diacylglycerol kinase [Parahaliea maris]TXS96171.1 diacylglycerol kinase [Parahaliea maris]
MYRVIQWSTGNVGQYALRSIAVHPELELVGLWVHSKDKVGRDAASFAGGEPTGILSTDDADALLAMDADCVCFTAAADTRMEAAVDDLCRILEAGKNVVASSPVALIHQDGLGPEVRQRLEAACQQGGASLFVNGIDPGWANDIFPLTFTGIVERWSSVRIQEIVNYATYDQPDIIFGGMGFGGPLDNDNVFGPPGTLPLMWGGTVRLIAEGLGVELDEIRETWERAPTPFSFDALGRTIEKGTCAAVRFEVQGIVGGQPRIVVEHVTRMHDDVVPDWPQGHGYVLNVKGEPNLECRFDMYDSTGDTALAGTGLTATRITNAIPAVCQARTGFLSALDLPLVTGKGLLDESMAP